ncbi:hypothetical protein [Rhizobium leguminosarum]|uniref:hypothetical protein n=1 Tax=Rhizobium leguminosarum TaxID=384 RepID=UPI003F990031
MRSIALIEGTRELAEVLHVSGPFQVEQAPNAYSFERNNRIAIDWKALLADLRIVTDDSNWRRFEKYVRVAWGGSKDQPTIEKNAFDLTPDWPAFVHDAGTVTNLQNPVAAEAINLFRQRLAKYRSPPTTGEPIPIVGGCVLRIKTKDLDRWYQPITGLPSGEIDFPSRDAFIADWEGTWREIIGLVQVYYDKPANFDTLTEDEKKAIQIVLKAEASTTFQTSELIRADAATISRQYEVLKNDKVLAEAIETKAGDLANQISTMPVESIQAVVDQYRDLMKFGIDLREKKRKLADAASDLNYHLFTEDATVRIYLDGTGAAQDFLLKEGELYLKSNKVATWFTYQTVTHKSWFSKSSYSFATKHAKAFDYYEIANKDYDPWVEVLDMLAGAGYRVYLFRLIKNELQSADGSKPSEVMAWCEESEAFRRKCVVALPRLELSIFGDQFVVGYDIIYRPVPDISATRYPDIFIHEKMSYRFTWEGVALGELAATIPLSPGEEREVSLTSSYKYETSRSETASSLIDITRVDRSDFETFFEKELRKDKETNIAASASVSGSYGGVVSGSGSFSTSTTTKEMARSLNRSVQKAAQEVNRRSKEERTVTVTEKAETLQQNVVKYNVKNINQGCTLNVAFYRLQNVYRSLLQLEDYSYAVSGGRALASDSNLVTGRDMPVDKVEQIVEWLLEEDNFPFDLSNVDKAALLAAIQQEIDKHLDDAYDTFVPLVDSGEKSLGRRKELLKAGNEIVNATLQPFKAALKKHGSAEADIDLDRLKDNARLLRANLSGTSFKSEETVFAYDSGGLYADLYLGDNPGTEPYSENMRRLEEERVRAENGVTNARARYLNARAHKQMLAVGGVLDASKAYVTNRTVLYMEDGHVELKLQLIPSILWNSSWNVKIKTIGGTEGGTFLQSGDDVEGILKFILPRRFNGDGSDLGDENHNWFATNVQVNNIELALTLKYKEP